MCEDKITVICESTKERNEKAKKNFELIKPLLDDGDIYSRAVQRVGLCNNASVMHYRWFKDIIEYGEKQGYNFKDYSGKGKRR